MKNNLGDNLCCLQDYDKELNRRKQEAVNRYLRKQIAKKKRTDKKQTYLILRYNKVNYESNITLETLSPINGKVITFPLTINYIESFGDLFGYEIVVYSEKVYIVLDRNSDILQLSQELQAMNYLYAESFIKEYIKSETKENVVSFSLFGCIFTSLEKKNSIVLLPNHIINFAKSNGILYETVSANNYFGVERIDLFLNPPKNEI